MVFLHGSRVDHEQGVGYESIWFSFDTMRVTISFTTHASQNYFPMTSKTMACLSCIFLISWKDKKHVGMNMAPVNIKYAVNMEILKRESYHTSND